MDDWWGSSRASTCSGRWSSPSAAVTAGRERATAWVDLAAIARNCALLARRLGPGRALCAVVKADGYGHGALLAARAALSGGAARLAVATAAEARALRDGGVTAPLLVMGALTDAELELALRSDAEVVVWDPRFAERVAAAAARIGRPARCHVKLDTGMGRLGTRSEREAIECAELARTRGSLELAGLMTHFATADELDDDGYFVKQRDRFARFVETVKARHTAVVAHAANSAALLRDPRAHFDMARCGIAIYGLDPFHEHPARRDLVPALRLVSYIACVKELEPGESVGYGRTWRAAERTRVGIVPIGYGDGVRRALSNVGSVLVRGVRRPIVGTVSMDNIACDLGPRRDSGDLGDEVVLVGEQGGERITAEEVARLLGTINYEVTTALTARVPRRPVGAGASGPAERGSERAPWQAPSQPSTSGALSPPSQPSPPPPPSPPSRFGPH